MAVWEHPAYNEEKNHLADTLKVIANERRIAENDRMEAEGSLSNARMYDPDALPIREMLYARAVQTERNLAQAAKKPYFTRIDFTQTGDVPRTYYIGKYGVLRTDSLEVEVVDWRAPVANLYYSGQIGPLKYSAPDGEVEGELTLKRQFTIEDGNINAILDADLVSQDEYLQGVLSETTGDRLKEIVTTIQAEQNYVIRYPLEKNLVVQGVAGSGKTTIALHRIAYLLYTYQDRLQPGNMLILAPNPLFLNFIAQVLPDLGVENVRQTTYQRFLGDYLGKLTPAAEDGDRLSDILNMDDEELERYTKTLRYKGSYDMLRRLDGWLDGFESRFVPDSDIRFGPITIYENAELRRFLLVDEKPFPLKRRLEELKKQLKLRVKAAVNRINDWYKQECDRRIMDLPKSIADKDERTRRAQQLLDSLAKRRQETIKQGREFPERVVKLFGDLEPAALYRKFLRDMLDSGAQGGMRLAAERTLGRRVFEREDMALIAVIAMRVSELKRVDVRHVVMDEAQDFNAVEVELLRRICRGATFTVVGDLMQGIAGYRGIADWDEMTKGVFRGQCKMHELVTSYRNTMEIMEFASRVVKNMPVANLSPAKPVLRHGEEPIFEPGDDARVYETACAWEREGMKSIAVMARSRKRLEELSEKYGWPVLDPEAEEYPAGTVLAPADAVKGLEFDAVILADADGETYPGRALDARLLYVCLTRALHMMAVFYEGSPTELLNA